MANIRPDVDPGRPAIELEDVFKAFVAGGSKSAKLALDDVSLSVPAGDFCSIVGPSGCAPQATSS